jgi:hypothetical protein
MPRKLIALLIALVVTGCIAQKQRALVSKYDPRTGELIERIYCTQRNTLFAMFGENAELHKMDGACGTFEGEAENVGFNEEGRKALEGAVKAGICAASGGVGCLGSVIGGGE